MLEDTIAAIPAWADIAIIRVAAVMPLIKWNF